MQIYHPLLRIIPVVILLLGLLLSGISVPLIKGSVPLNSTYGIRTKSSLSSNENWYKANKIGGTFFLVAGIVIALLGFIGLFVPNRALLLFVIGSGIAILVIIIGGGVTISNKL